jgi:formate/nitrite transporter FocA (FNT family)
MLTSMLPATPWRHLIASAGYTVGFVVTVLGRQELFTESTLTAMLPLLVRRDRATLFAVLRFWIIVLAANLVGTALFALLLVHKGLFDASVTDALAQIARTSFENDFGLTLLKAVLSGWLIALMAWVLPSARSARLFVILLLTYVVALCGLPHVVAGSGEAAYAVFTGNASLSDYLVGFLLPTLIGNTIGGVALVALLNHAPLAQDLKDRGATREPT